MRIPMVLSRCLLPVLLAAAAPGACQDAPQVAPSGETKITVTTGRARPRASLVARLPAGRTHARHRAAGRLRYVTREGALSEPIAGVPAVYAEGQGGLLDVILDPGFRENSTIYLSLRGAGGGRDERHRGRARAPRRRRGSPTSRSSSASSRKSRASTFRLAPRVRARRQPVRHHRRAQLAARQGAGPRHPPRQDHAHHAGRRRAAGQSLRRPRRRAAGDLVATAIATRRARR